MLEYMQMQENAMSHEYRAMLYAMRAERFALENAIDIETTDDEEDEESDGGDSSEFDDFIDDSDLSTEMTVSDSEEQAISSEDELSDEDGDDPSFTIIEIPRRGGTIRITSN